MTELSADDQEVVRYEERELFLAVGRPALGDEEPAREALRVLAGKLRAVVEHYGEMEAEARIVWLASLLPLGGVADMVRVLSGVGTTLSFIDNWSDCVRSGTPQGARAAVQMAKRYRSAEYTVREMYALAPLGPGLVDAVGGALLAVAEEQEKIAEAAEEDALVTIVEPARVAAHAALMALCALVDAMRERAPEGLR